MSRRVLLSLLLLAAAAFLVRPGLIGGDEPHYAAMASSLAFDRDVDLTNQYEEIEAKGSTAAGKRFAGQRLERHLVQKPTGEQFSHPLGLPLLAAPLLWVAQGLLALAWPDPALGLLTIVASFLGLAAGASLLARFLGDRREGLFFAVAVFCASPLWFYSRTFFTEPFVWSGLVVAIWLLSRSRWLAGGAVLGLVVLIREPSLLLVAPILCGLFLLRGGRAAAAAVLGPAMAVGLVLARNLWLNGGGVLDFAQPFRYGDGLSGARGLLVDTAHGLVPFMPLALLAPLGLFFARDASQRIVLGCSAAAFLACFALSAAWVDWRGGSSFGPRLIVPAIPFLVPAIALAWRRLADRGWSFVAVALTALGVAVEVTAIADPFDAFWSASLRDLLTHSGSSLATAALAAAFSGWLIHKYFPSRSRMMFEQEASNPAGDRGAGTRDTRAKGSGR